MPSPLKPMLPLLAFLLAGCQAGSGPDFNALAKARNADGLLAASGPEVRKLDNPFRFIRTNGPYDTGRFGWTAVPAKSPAGKRYVVFTTRMTSEDYGDFVFETDGRTLIRYIPERETLGHRIEHQKLSLEFELPAKRANLESEMRVRRSANAATEFLIRLSPQYRVSKVANAAGQPVPFAQAGGVVWMPSPATSPFTYKLTYSGVVDQPQYAGSITTREAMLTNDYWYPMIARLPQTYEATVRVPKSWTAIAQGELTRDETVGATRSMTWKMDLPAVYWSLSAAPYRTFSQILDGRKFQIWSLTMSEPQMRMQTELFSPILKFFETLAPYPFTYWGAVDSPVYGSGALEAYSFATYGAGWLPDEDAHEPSHTWFGGLINNTYLNSFWNESFAAYCEGLYNREGPIGNVAEKQQAFVSDARPSPSYAQAALDKAGAFSGPVASDLGYGKGAKVLQMLESELGVEAMMAAMRNWLKVHPKGEPGEWSHFEAAVKASSGRDMTRFFDEWVRRPGWADFTVENVRWESPSPTPPSFLPPAGRQKQGRGSEAPSSFSQENASESRSFGKEGAGGWRSGKIVGEAVFKGTPYHLLCEVLLEFPSGERRFEKVRLTPIGSRASFEIPADFKPTLVSFDPWRKLLRRTENNEAPMSLESFLDRARRYSDPRRSNWLNSLSDMTLIAELPEDLNGVFLVGSPETLTAMAPLCERAGFKVEGNNLTYDGTTIDLTKGAALALVDLPGGGRCAIGLGRTRRTPHPGRAKVALVDDLGRFLRGKTEPKTSGFLTVKL